MPSRGLQVCLALLRIAAGISILGPGLHKLGWFAHPVLEQQLAGWLSHQTNPALVAYLKFMIPHASVLARVIAVGELTLGTLLILGLLTPLAAAVAFLMVANFHFGSGAMLQLDYVTGQDGLVYLLLFPVLLVGRAGLALGIDGMLGKKMAGGGAK